MTTPKSVLFLVCLIILVLAAICTHAQHIDENHIYVETAILTGGAVASNDPDPGTILPDLTGIFLSTNSKALELGYKIRIVKLGMMAMWGSNKASAAVYQEKLTDYRNLSAVIGLDTSADLGSFVLGINGKIGPGILQYSKKQPNKTAIVVTENYSSMFLGASGTIGIKIRNIAFTLNPTANMVFCKDLLVYSYGGGIGVNFYF